MQRESEKTTSTAIKVYVRVRPLVGAEAGSKEIVTVEEDVSAFIKVVQNRKDLHRLGLSHLNQVR